MFGERVAVVQPVVVAELVHYGVGPAAQVTHDPAAGLNPNGQPKTSQLRHVVCR